MGTHDVPDGLLLCRRSLFHRIIKDEIKENIEPTKSTADFAAALNIYEQFLVHELEIYEVSYRLIQPVRKTILPS